MIRARQSSNFFTKYLLYAGFPLTPWNTKQTSHLSYSLSFVPLENVREDVQSVYGDKLYLVDLFLGINYPRESDPK